MHFEMLEGVCSCSIFFQDMALVVVKCHSTGIKKSLEQQNAMMYAKGAHDSGSSERVKESYNVEPRGREDQGRGYLKGVPALGGTTEGAGKLLGRSPRG